MVLFIRYAALLFSSLISFGHTITMYLFKHLCRSMRLMFPPFLRRFNAFFYLGSDLPEATDSGRSQDNIFRENTIVGGIESITVKESDGTQFVENSFKDAAAIRFDNAERTVMLGNTGLDGARVKVTNGASFDAMSDNGFEPIY